MSRGNLSCLVAIAATLWFFMFSPWTSNIIPFWWAMPIAGVLLITISIVSGGVRIEPPKGIIGSMVVAIAGAALLWVIFWIGKYLSVRWFGFAAGQIDSIYMIKDGENPLLLSLLLLFIIGPAEEIFWRGCLQRHLGGGKMDFLFTAIIYAGVHIWSFNFMLIMAALVCGLFWGLMYKIDGRLSTVIVCHALWDVAAFVLFPL